MDILTMILEYVWEESLILVPVLYILGMIIKNLRMFNDKYIPVILLAFGILGAIAIMGMTTDAILQGILVAGATVFFNQIFKQNVEPTKNALSNKNYMDDSPLYEFEKEEYNKDEKDPQLKSRPPSKK